MTLTEDGIDIDESESDLLKHILLVALTEDGNVYRWQWSASIKPIRSKHSNRWWDGYRWQGSASIETPVPNLNDRRWDGWQQITTPKRIIPKNFHIFSNKINISTLFSVLFCKLNAFVLIIFSFTLNIPFITNRIPINKSFDILTFHVSSSSIYRYVSRSLRTPLCSSHHWVGLGYTCISLLDINISCWPFQHSRSRQCTRSTYRQSSCGSCQHGPVYS